MSKRRNPNDVVRRLPGSCFLGSGEPSHVRLAGPGDGALWEGDDSNWPTPELRALRDGFNSWREWMSPCMCECGDDECVEWANVQVVGGPHDGEWLCHLSECQMSDGDGGA